MVRFARFFFLLRLTMPAKNNGTEWKANEQYWRSTVRFWYDVQDEINLFLWMVKKKISLVSERVNNDFSVLKRFHNTLKILKHWTLVTRFWHGQNLYWVSFKCLYIVNTIRLTIFEQALYRCVMLSSTHVFMAFLDAVLTLPKLHWWKWTGMHYFLFWTVLQWNIYI